MDNQRALSIVQGGKGIHHRSQKLSLSVSKCLSCPSWGVPLSPVVWKLVKAISTDNLPSSDASEELLDPWWIFHKERASTYGIQTERAFRRRRTVISVKQISPLQRIRTRITTRLHVTFNKGTSKGRKSKWRNNRPGNSNISWALFLQTSCPSHFLCVA